MRQHESEFAEFFRTGWQPCLRAVAASTGDLPLAEEQVAEAFARAWASWRSVRCHPAPRAWVVRTALNTGASSWRRRGRELPLTGHETDPAAVPSGTELSIGEFQVSNGQQAALTLVTQGSYSCSSTVPATLPPGGALLHMGSGGS